MGGYYRCGRWVVVFIFVYILNVSAETEVAAMSGELRLFPRKDNTLSLIAQEYRHYVEFGQNNNRRVARANAGFDFPGIEYCFGNKSIGVGVAALVNLYMFPEGATFHVDNFYATFGGYLWYELIDKVVIRFYPFYHLSAHLADGYHGENVKADKRVISNEKMYALVQWDPLSALQLSMGGGWYFHTSNRKELKAILNVNGQFFPRWFTYINPICTIQNWLIFEDHARYGVDFSCGVVCSGKSEHHLSVMFRTYANPHWGQYYETREKGVGIQCGFIY